MPETRTVPKPQDQKLQVRVIHHATASAPYWRHFALGFGSSILLHEASHVAMAYALGAHPSFGFDKGRPTIFSGISTDRHPHAQFLFSSAGLTAQSLLDEAILDIPHRGRGAAFERGVLAGGIATVAFYATLGRNASVSDVSYMAHTSSLSKTQVSLIYGAVAALHAVRIARDAHYADFFVRPAAEGGLVVGCRVDTSH
jgi:hypothetical protein